MNHPEIKNSELIVFKSKSGQTEFLVVLDEEHNTVWTTEQQIMDLFGKARRTIGEHIKNIYAEGELDKSSTWREFRQVQKEGSREVFRKITIYNLDVIISVGYRVKSKVGVEFRKWATSKLKDYLVKGYVINQELLKSKTEKIAQLKTEINFLNESVFKKQMRLTDGFLSIISHYSKSFELLSKYDTEELSLENLNKEIIYVINYGDVMSAIAMLKTELIKKVKRVICLGMRKTIHLKEF